MIFTACHCISFLVLGYVHCLYHTDISRIYEQIVLDTKGMNFGNLYSKLRLTAAATQSEIKSAYYRLCKIYHPDKNQDCQKAAQQFRIINEAYKVLGNEESRALYDQGTHIFKMHIFSHIFSEIIFIFHSFGRSFTAESDKSTI